MARASEEKTRQLFQEYQKTRSVELRNEIVELNLYLVDILIKKYMNKGVEREDLYQVASMALVLAVERFDPSRGFEFTSFATPTIIGEIKRHFRDKGWAMKVPRRLKELSIKLPEAKEALENKLGRPPKMDELAAFLEVTLEELLEAMESGKAYGAYSLQQTFDSDDSGDEAPALEKYAAHHESGYTSFENADFIRSVVAGFSEQERTVFRRRFLEEKTQQEIADELGISQMSVSRMEKKLKEKFKEEFYR